MLTVYFELIHLLRLPPLQLPLGPTNPSHSQLQVVIINSPPSPINVDRVRLAVEPHADS